MAAIMRKNAQKETTHWTAWSRSGASVDFVRILIFSFLVQLDHTFEKVPSHGGKQLDFLFLAEVAGVEGVALKNGTSKNLDAKIVLGKLRKSCQTAQKMARILAIVLEYPSSCGQKSVLVLQRPLWNSQGQELGELYTLPHCRKSDKITVPRLGSRLLGWASGAEWTQAGSQRLHDQAHFGAESESETLEASS